jgi:hypothetical protein
MAVWTVAVFGFIIATWLRQPPGLTGKRENSVATNRKIIVIVLVAVMAIIAVIIQLQRGFNMYSGPVPFHVPEPPPPTWVR